MTGVSVPYLASWPEHAPLATSGAANLIDRLARRIEGALQHDDARSERTETTAWQPIGDRNGEVLDRRPGSGTWETLQAAHNPANPLEQGLERERRVTDPAEAVVPVALAGDVLRREAVAAAAMVPDDA
jgi:hypothetical protein